MNLIVVKCTRIEIYLLTADGLQPVADVPIYGRIATLELFRPPGESQDLIFLSTERYHFCVLAYDTATRELVTRAGGDIQDRIGRPTDNGQVGIIDPDCRMIGLHLYDGLFKIIPIDAQGKLHDAFNIRLEELNVITIKFLYGCEKPTIAILYQDTKSAKHIRTYSINLRDKEFEVGPWDHNNLDMGANVIIPVPMPLGGAIVIGEQTIMYFDGATTSVIPIKQTITKAYGIVDLDGSRYLLSDITGTLHLLVLVHSEQKVVNLKLEQLGKTSVASTLSYLDNGVVFVGSSYGDSQLIRLSQSSVNDEPNNYVEVLDTFVNLGPIVDFSVAELEHQGQGQVVTCSGVYADGSLRVIRNGIGINEQASVELPGVKGMWSLCGSASSNDDGDAAYDKYLLVTFVGETRVLAINEEEELEETEIAGLDSEEQTLLCANVANDQIVQVTPKEVRLIDANSHMLVESWQPESGNNEDSLKAKITAATCTSGRLLVALSQGHLVYIELQASKLVLKSKASMPAEVSCIDIGPREQEGLQQSEPKFACMGSWDMNITVCRLPDLQVVCTVPLGVDVIPRSSLICRLEGVLYCMVALGDGHLFTFVVEEKNDYRLTDRKKVSLGTQPMTLKLFTTNGSDHVFAASDRPTVIYSSNKKLLYSNVNLREVSHMSSFNSEQFPECLAFIQDETMVIGTIDQIQKLHIRTVPLGEQPRRICHQKSSNTFAVCTVSSDFESTKDDNEVNYVRLIDDQTFETLAKFQLDVYEQNCSIVSCTFEKDEKHCYYLVGTAYAPPDEVEPNKGRILVFLVKNNNGNTTLDLVSSKEVRGAVYNLNSFNGKLLAGVNSKVQVYRWQQREEGSWELANECSHHNHILALYVQSRGDFIVVGDLMKSISLLVYKPEEGTIELLACDFNTNWMTAIQILDDETYLGAENSCNLFTVKRNSECATEEYRQKLEVVGQFHLGEFVNRFRKGSLVMQLPESGSTSYETLIFGTVNGCIGIVASLPADKYQMLHKLEQCLNKIIKGVGGLSHQHWRSFYNERKVEEASGFIDGDLIESYLDLKKEKMDQVAQLMGMDPEDLSKQVEELARLH
jgi:DNA damage-binding protein 1